MKERISLKICMLWMCSKEINQSLTIYTYRRDKNLAFQFPTLSPTYFQVYHTIYYMIFSFFIKLCESSCSHQEHVFFHQILRGPTQILRCLYPQDLVAMMLLKIRGK